MKKTRIISAFPACGKSYIFENMKFIDCVDSDSSKFSWVLDENGNSTGVRNPEFPDNYKQHIVSLIGKVDYIFVSSHKEVRDMLNEADLCWVSVMPSSELKNEWVGRCFTRGNTEGFCKLIQNNWESWVCNNKNEGAVGWVTLKSNEYLSNHMDFISTTTSNS